MRSTTRTAVGAAGALPLTGGAGWLGRHVKPPPLTGRWEDQEEHYVVLDLEDAEYRVDVFEKVPGAVPWHGGLCGNPGGHTQLGSLRA